MAGIILLISVVVIIFIFIPHKQSADDDSGVSAELIQQYESLRLNGAKRSIFLVSDENYEEMDGWTFKIKNGETLVLHRVTAPVLIAAYDSRGQAKLVRGARYLLVRQDKN